MKTTSLPTVAELNALQTEWMALDSSDPNAKAFCDRMDRIMPKRHITVTDAAPGMANMYDFGPVWGSLRPLSYVLETAKAAGIRTDVAWNCRGEWVAL